MCELCGYMFLPPPSIPLSSPPHTPPSHTLLLTAPLPPPCSLPPPPLSLTHTHPLSHTPSHTQVTDMNELAVDTSTKGTQWGTGGMGTKLTAARIATAAGCKMAICNAVDPGNILGVLAGEQRGTVFHALPKPPRCVFGGGMCMSVCVCVYVRLCVHHSPQKQQQQGPQTLDPVDATTRGPVARCRGRCRSA